MDYGCLGPQGPQGLLHRRVPESVIAFWPLEGDGAAIGLHDFRDKHEMAQQFEGLLSLSL